VPSRGATPGLLNTSAPRAFSGSVPRSGYKRFEIGSLAEAITQPRRGWISGHGCGCVAMGLWQWPLMDLALARVWAQQARAHCRTLLLQRSFATRSQLAGQASRFLAFNPFSAV